jgi:hypothetical protein
VGCLLPSRLATGILALEEDSRRWSRFFALKRAKQNDFCHKTKEFLSRTKRFLSLATQKE